MTVVYPQVKCHDCGTIYKRTVYSECPVCNKQAVAITLDKDKGKKKSQNETKVKDKIKEKDKNGVTVSTKADTVG